MGDAMVVESSGPVMEAMAGEGEEDNEDMVSFVLRTDLIVCMQTH